MICVIDVIRRVEEYVIYTVSDSIMWLVDLLISSQRGSENKLNS